MRAGAGAFGNVEHMVLLNGADGMSDMFAKALTMGGTGLGLARQLLSSMGQDQNGQAGKDGSAVNGHVAPPAAPPSQKVPVDGDS